VVEGEGVTAVYFGESLPSRNEFDLSKCLYVGTSLGSVLVIVIVIPDSEEKRETENVIVSPSGSLLRLRSAVLEFTLLDSSLHLDEREEPLENIRTTIRNKQNLQTGSQEAASPAMPLGDQLVLAVATEKGASCFALPSQRQIGSHQVADPATVIRATAVSWLGEKKCSPVLLFFTSEGKVRGLSLPTFRTLIDSPLVMHTSARISRTLRFSTGGTGAYFTNPNQIQKFSVNKEETKNVFESFGKFYQETVDMPEAPKQSFFKGFFGGGAKQLDRNELFGESKASSSLAVTTQGPAMTDVTANSISAESEIFKAKQAVCERGNKLNEVEEKTERLATDAQIWADTSHKMMEKYKKQKWYQF
jgi:syntaxin-binding protein 5